MITYQMHSNKYNVDYQIKFDDDAILLGFEILITGGEHECVIDLEVRRLIFESILKLGNVYELRAFCTKNKIELVEVLMDLSFVSFWNKYAYKEGSKIETEKVWNKLSDVERTKALDYINRYNQSLQANNVAKVYPVRYLKNKYWVK